MLQTEQVRYNFGSALRAVVSNTCRVEQKDSLSFLSAFPYTVILVEHFRTLFNTWRTAA